MDYQDKCANGMWVRMIGETLTFAGVEETHGDGTGMINGRKSFTLVELLVVIAIIGILSAILLTSVAKTKKSAHRIECLNFQRQLYIFYYADNWDEGTTEISPSYTKAELMDAYPRIKQSCYDCHASALTVVR
jgi:prepilin-type N-terminal cleavage/methylation domain-containing protein